MAATNLQHAAMLAHQIMLERVIATIFRNDTPAFERYAAEVLQGLEGLANGAVDTEGKHIVTQLAIGAFEQMLPDLRRAISQKN